MSPTSSKNSSNESLNYLSRKEVLDSQNAANSNSVYSMNTFNLTKKKSLKTTLYRIFTQRKKSKNKNMEKKKEKILKQKQIFKFKNSALYRSTILN